MSNFQRMARAYQNAGNLRSQRERDADVFDIFASRLREGEREGGLTLAKALADNARLWRTVTTITLDDNNPQPASIRRSMLLLANSIMHEMGKPDPNLRILIEANCNVAAGLRGVAPSVAVLRNGAQAGGAAAAGG